METLEVEVLQQVQEVLEAVALEQNIKFKLRLTELQTQVVEEEAQLTAVHQIIQPQALVEKA